MRVWIYGKDLEQIQKIKDESIHPNDIVIGTSTCTEDAAAFPHGGLTPALYTAMRAEIDQLIVSDRSLLGSEFQREQMAELFQSYGVSIKSASNRGISSS